MHGQGSQFFLCSISATLSPKFFTVSANIAAFTTPRPILGTDSAQDRNIILALSYEYRAPSAEVIRKAIEASGNPSAPVNWDSRYVGLVVIPGAHVQKIEFEETLLPGQKSSIIV